MQIALKPYLIQLERDFEFTQTGRLSAGEIASYFELTGATISHYLTILKAADLIHEMREKTLFTMS